MALTSTIIDNFEDGVLAPYWSGSYGTVTESGGRAQVPCTTGYNALATMTTYTWNDVYARLYAPSLASASAECYLSMTLYSASQDAGTDVGFYIDVFGGVFYCVSRVSYFDASASAIAYNSSTHAWMRILRSGPSILFQTSSDGTTWTIRRTMAAPSWLTSATDLQLVFESHRNNGTDNNAEVDNVNTTGVTTGTMAEALNTSAPAYLPSTIIADWAEDLPGEASNPNPDSARILSEQCTGEYVVAQSLEDSLPDAVTMTSGNDASTKAVVNLGGREEVYGQTIGWRTAATGTGSGTSVTPTIPTGTDWGDYTIVAIALDTTNTLVTEASDGQAHGWTLLATQDDGSGLETYVYGRPWYAGSTGPVLTFSFSVNYSWVAVSAYARMADGTQVPWKPGTVTYTAETNVVSLHTAPTAELTKSGFLVGVWGSVGTPTWTAGAGSTELGEANTATSGLPGVMISSTPFQGAGSQALTANTNSTTSVATLMAIPLNLQERPRQDARAYFSPFNHDSPLYGRDRDTALTQIDFNVLGSGGALPTTIHRGQMANIAMSGDVAQMSAVSKTRLDLDGSHVLPEIWGQREGLTPDWVALWLAARGGQYAGPAPTPYTIYWNPLYGSTHAMLDGDSTIVSEGPNFTYRQDYDDNGATVAPPNPTLRPQFVEGPFHTAVYAQQTNERIEHIVLEPYPTTTGLPFLSAPSVLADQFSQANSIGRLSFWVRGDHIDSNPAFLAAHGITNRDMGFRYTLALYDTPHVNYLGYLEVAIRSSDRQILVTMGQTSIGFTGVLFASLGPIPEDGAWHFVAVAWDLAVGRVKVKLDGNESTNNYWQVNQPPVPSEWPATDADREPSAGGSDPINNLVFIHMPLSDLQIEAGQPWSDDFSVHYPTPAAPSQTALTRVTGRTLGGMALTAPVSGWSALAELAQATLSAYRVDEEDNLNFLPLSYFGEAAQMTPTEIVDTEVNAAELDVFTDPTKLRNVVTVEYEEASVTTMAVPVLVISQVITIPAGVSYWLFSLDVLVTEMYGKNTPGSDTSGNWTLWNLTTPEIDGTQPPTSIGHYMTVNTKEDGTGTNLSWDFVKARIMSYTASTAVVRFTNNLTVPTYLSNNGDAIPFLVLRGNAYTTTNAYATARDDSSVAARRERSLSTTIPWIDNRTDATEIAQALATLLARPRAELKVQTVGDPRRKPGQLVTIADAQGTHAQGNWRVLDVEHNVSGASYTQNLSLTFQMDIGLWDASPGWNNEAWGE